MAYSILVNSSPEASGQAPVRGPLVSWVMSRVEQWERHRASNYDQRWLEYYRLWRGVWSTEDKTRHSERSRLISPALQQAVEAAVSELEEATFSRDRWIDVSDDVGDADKESLSPIVDQLVEDSDLAGVPDAIAEAYMNGALYGTLIAKVVLDSIDEKHAVERHVEGTDVRSLESAEEKHTIVRVVPVDPKEFVIDPAAKDIDSALGVAHVTLVSRHMIVDKQRSGVYREGDLGSYTPSGEFERTGETGLMSHSDLVKIVEYHGLVPQYYLNKINRGGAEGTESLAAAVEPEEKDREDFQRSEDDLVEAIVTVANDTMLLRAVENPYLFKDRAFVACHYDLVPNRFWGRGIAEKGYNPQKALDAEQRARIDALAFSVHPMVGINAASLPRDGKFEVYAGRTIVTPGDPREHLHMMQFAAPDLQTYKQSAELERQIQMGTGSMDSASPIGVNPRNATASGMSMIMAGALKRSKRTMKKLERRFLTPLITKMAWRYMQFDDRRYPVKDYKFRVHTTLGIMAREFEQQLLTSLIATVPSESPAFWIILKGIFQYSSISSKDEIIGILDQLMQQSLQPPPPEEDPRVQLEAGRLQLEAQRHQDKTAQKDQELQIKGGEAQTRRMQAEADATLRVAKAEATRRGTELEPLKLLQGQTVRQKG